MFPIECPRLRRAILPKGVLHGYALACRSPHVRNVQVLVAVIVIIEPADTHAGPYIFYPTLSRNIVKRSVALIAIKVLTAEVINNIKIRPAISIRISPAATETVACIVLIQPRFSGGVTERAVAVVAHQKIRRSVFRIVVGQRIVVLTAALIKSVETEVNIEKSVAIVVRGGRASECAPRRSSEVKGIRLE